MSTPAILEQRLRVISFIFVVIGILLTIGSFVVAGMLADSADIGKHLTTLAPADAQARIILQVRYEGVANRCLGIGLFFVQLGILFFVYLLFSKVRILEGTM